ncbi:type II secretion system protein [Nocardioides baekrokdamisoli]|uniref:Type II secretion system protein n=1 Tax=Nocardioides baekrokdamisoli TaxID=1804624 RepID=A0A3G9IXR7_9ACTN|nr:type II secretion system F family protein [Nocardioides baekrokdamisoli]BBH17203.1 type II secretion system protein [Nocardioides baekrokdamisoli]
MLLIIGCVGICAALVMLIVLLGPQRAALPASMPSRRATVETEPSPSLVQSLLERSAGLTARMTKDGYRSRLQHRLDVAGNPPAWPADRVLALKGAGLIAGVVLGLLYGAKLGGIWALLGPVIGAAAGFFIPDILIRNLGERRQTELRNGLPDVIDMLTVCVEAGLGFDAALGRVVSNLDNPAAAEFARVMQEMQLGRSRVDALRDAGARASVSEFRTFVSSIVQSTELGISMGDVLRAQAGQMRIKRRQRAEEKAQKLPVKILPPLILCILPAMFVIVLGPAIMSIVGFFSKAG